MFKRSVLFAFVFAATLGFATALQAQMETTTRRDPDEGAGPFNRLVIRGATMIDGTGAPPRGPVDITIEGDRITSIRSVGYPGVPLSDRGRSGGADYEVDARGMYVLPGFIDMHVHTGGVPKAPQAEYIYKLWLAHGVTTVRGVPFGGFDWSLQEKALSERNEIVAPRMFSTARDRLGRGECDHA